MNIAIHNCQFSNHLGGTERLISYQIKELLNIKEVKLTLITKKVRNPSFFFKDTRELNKNNFELIEIEIPKSDNPYSSNNPFKYHIESIDFGLAAQSIYSKRNFDLVVTHFSTDSLFIPRNQKNILHLHGVPTKHSEIGEISTRRPDNFISVSKYVKRRWLELYPTIEECKIRVVYPGIDTEKFFSNHTNKVFDIVFVGRFITIKGIDTLIEAISKIDVPLKVCLVGDGPDKPRIINKIKGLGLTNRFTIYSNIPDSQLLEMYNKSKIGVFPSYAKDGVILTMLEAAACGLAIITSCSCSMPEFIKDGANGLFFKPCDAQDLADKISKLINDQSLQEKINENAAIELQSKWNNETRGGQLFDTYKIL